MTNLKSAATQSAPFQQISMGLESSQKVLYAIDMLTTREQDVLHFIHGYVAQHGRAPLLSEIALGIGIQSRGVVHRYVQRLADEGEIRLIQGRHRGIELVSEAVSKHGSSKDSLTSYTLPLMGKIAAGLPIEAIPDHNEIDLSEFFVRPNRFVLKVQGDSMIEAGILNNDMVVVEHTQRANNDDIVVALIDNEEATLKRLRHEPAGCVTLYPANARLSPMVYAAERVQIQGIVVGQMRSYR